MTLLAKILAASLGYFLGSISFSRLFVRLFAPNHDLADLEIPLEGEGQGQKVNIFGANAASMVLGPKFGILVALLDMSKVILPMMVIRGLFPEESLELSVAIGGLLGHNWPLFHRFKGGRGFSVIYASFLVIDWVGALVTPVVGILIGMVGLQNLTVGYLSWLWLMIPWFFWRGEPFDRFYYALIVNGIFFLAVLPEARMFLKLRREGKLDSYLTNLYKSSPAGGV